MYGSYYYGYYNTWIILLPAILLTLYAQVKVKSAYAKYSRIANGSGATGAFVAQTLFQHAGIGNVAIRQTAGQLTDNYNPTNMTLNLSQGVYSSNSVAAICIAAHECGHACQHKEGYSLLRLRNAMVPAVNICSQLSWPLLLIGLFLGSNGLFNGGIVLFCVAIAFHLVTLPVELNASSRGLKMLQDCGFIRNDIDLRGSKAVLRAAAMTYLASLAMSIANLLRILAMRNNSRR